MAYKYFKDKTLSGECETRWAIWRKELISKADFFSSTLDANCEDKEASLYAATATYYLALVTKGGGAYALCRIVEESSLFCFILVLYLGRSLPEGQMLGDIGHENSWLEMYPGGE